ncbi:hypothetical protein [Methanimicrococcus stummii]|uniref:hypothetical protein n=1 Tax=Methanimicrococcus stummii TaxID=3028294 RepID=UPI00292EB528|nr:hypothetical protein [Methanimicrococcus sp. Es2]
MKKRGQCFILFRKAEQLARADGGSSDGQQAQAATQTRDSTHVREANGCSKKQIHVATETARYRQQAQTAR